MAPARVTAGATKLEFQRSGAGPKVPRLFACARQGALTSWLKSNAHPARGSASRTARVPVVRRDLKEAVSKTLARRTGTTYEAAAADEKAQRFKVQFLHGSCGSICGGHKRGSQGALPGEIFGGAIRRAWPRGRDDAVGEVSRSHSRSPRDRRAEHEDKGRNPCSR